MIQATGAGEPKRRRCAMTTRCSILEAASRRFAAEGYEGAGVRAIAADAGVTAALVNRYFGSKEGLFREVIAGSCDLAEVVRGDRATLPERLAHWAVCGRDDREDATQIPLLLLLRSATSPSSAAILRENLDENLVGPLASRIGGPDAKARAGLILAHITGFAIFETMLHTEAFAETGRDHLVGLLARALGSCLAEGP